MPSIQLNFFPQIIENKHEYILGKIKKSDSYDLREDPKISETDVVGFCRRCGRPVTKAEVKCVDVVTFTVKHLGPNANGVISVEQEYLCWQNGCK